MDIRKTKRHRTHRWVTVHRNSHLSYLLIRHELEGSLRGNFDDVHTIASPQWPHTTFFDHLHQTTHDAHVVSSGSINLKKKGTRSRLDRNIWARAALNFRLHQISTNSHLEIWCDFTGWWILGSIRELSCQTMISYDPEMCSSRSV